jgi:signal transduction histidine kinase
MHLVNVVMAGEAVELVRLSDEYLHESNRELDLLTTSMMTGFRNYRTVNNLFSVFTVLLGIAASFLITRSIVQPLRHITDALSGLTKGDYTGAIQGADRGDEFGRLAAAAKVFREKSDKVEELLADSRKTERRMSSYAAELETRNRELDEFTNLASHDLQEPLRKLITFSKLLPSDIGGDLPERAKSDIEFIADAAERMRNLVRDLLELARTGTKEISIETVDVGQCVDEALRAVTGRIEETGAVIEKDELPVIRGNARLISQLFQNLISNALKFIDSNRVPKIRVTAEWKDSKWVLGVSDNGIGIPDNGKTRIFEAFRRLHGKGTYAGTGIGLAICRKAVDRHNGAIWVESEVGKGSHFQFFLKPEEESWITEKAPAEPLCSSSKTILAIRN